MFPPIHPDGWRFIAIAAVIALVLFFVWEPLGWLGVALTIWVAAFFRDPWRVSPQAAGIALAPGDGEIVEVGHAAPPPELDMGEAPMLRIGIFLSVLDVHINRMPIAGRVTKMSYRKGAFRDARDPLSGTENERIAVRIAMADGTAAAVTQIAGRIARRIVCDLTEGQDAIAGQRFGLIRFGSRAEVYVPASWLAQVRIGQRAIAGETVVAAAGPGLAVGADTPFTVH
jgi:phosphatidylserine decarboxylase